MKDWILKYKGGISIVTTIVVLWLLFSTVRWMEIWLIFKKINAELFVFALLLSSCSSVLVWSGRFMVIIKALGGKISYLEAIQIKMGSQPFNFLPSGQADILSQVVYLKKNHQCSYVVGLSYVFLGLVLKVLPLLLPVLVGAVFLCKLSGVAILDSFKFVLFLFFMAGGAFAVLWGLIVISRSRQIIFSWIKRLIPRFEHNARSALDLCGNISGKTMMELLSISMVAQLIQLLVFYLLSCSLGLNISFFVVLFLLPFVLVLSNIPLTVAGLGLREWLILVFFASYGGKEIIFALALLFTFVDCVVPAILGLFFMRSYLRKLI